MCIQLVRFDRVDLEENLHKDYDICYFTCESIVLFVPFIDLLSNCLNLSQFLKNNSFVLLLGQ